MAKYLTLKPVEFDNLSAKVRAGFDWSDRILLPKYDGCCMLVGFKDGAPAFMLSRSNEPVRSCEHIYDALLKAYPWVRDRKEGVCFIGEAWTPDAAFNEISGAFRRHSPSLGLSFAVFDVVEFTPDFAGPVLFSRFPYLDRLMVLEEGVRGTSVLVPMAVRCMSENHAREYAQKLKTLGAYDGAVVSDPNAGYIPGSGACGSFIKVKPLITQSLLVVGVRSASGAKTGRPTVALEVEWRGGVTGVGTGFTNEQAAEWVAQPSLIVGKIVEVAAMGIHPGKQGGLREARFLGIRADVITPD